VGQAADLYDEIKEHYGVAERGNALQAQRALFNVAALEREVKRVTEQVEQQSDNQTQIKQIESQNRALDSLRRSRQQLEQRFVGYVASTGKRPVPADQTVAIFGLLSEARGQTVESWKVNDEYLDRNKFEDNEGLQEFRKANFRRGTPATGAARGKNIGIGGGAGGAYRGPNGGVPPGLREPSDAPPPPPPTEPGGSPNQEATIYLGDKPVLGVMVQTGKNKAGGLTFEIDGKKVFNDGKDGDFRGRTENKFFYASRTEGGAGAGAKADVPLAALDDVTSGLPLTDFVPPQIVNAAQLTHATGRISLRIDLPKDGEVFHFATAGNGAAITVEASEPSGAIWKGLLAIVFLAIGASVLRVGR